MRRILFGGLIVLQAAFAAAKPPALEAARREVEELRYLDARARLDALVHSGGLSREELSDTYMLRGEVEAVIEGPYAAEREFRRALALLPEHEPPSLASPVMTIPFGRAQHWIAAQGALAIRCRASASVPAGAPIDVRVEAVDPLGMVFGARGYYRRVGADFTRFGDEGLQLVLPASPAGSVIEYYVEVFDESKNRLGECGRKEQPLAVTVTAPAPSPVASPAPTPSATAPPHSASSHRLRRGALGLAIASAVLLGTGIGLNIAAAHEYDSLQQRCAPFCAGAELGTLHAETAGAIASYALAGIGGITAGVLWLIDRRHAR